jgi:hypothetical protein
MAIIAKQEPKQVSSNHTKKSNSRPKLTMPCGWGCGAHLGAREIRYHFTDCPKRPTLQIVINFDGDREYKFIVL